MIFDYARLNISYFIHKKEYIEVFDVQGNKSNYVPQGLAYSEKYDIVLQSSYSSKHDVSMIYVTNFKTGKFLKELKLIEADDTENTSHVGGIAICENRVWITNDNEINEYDLEEILETENDYIKSIKNAKLFNGGDFCAYNNGILWVGEFFLKPFYNVIDDNPLLMGYKVEEKIDYSKPEYIISLPKMIQGMTITSNDEFVFTSSYTNLIKSNLSIYKNVLVDENEYYELNGIKIPYYKFDKSNLIKNIKLPPMAEGIFNVDDEFYILFENSSNKYFFAFPKIDKVIKYKIK